MRARLLLLPLGFLCAVIAYACAEHAPDSSPIGSTSQSIEDGRLINLKASPESSMFPTSTVFLQTILPSPTGPKAWNCTGVILTPNKILTAAHCQPGLTTTAYFYPTKPGAGAKRVPGQAIQASQTVFTEMQAGNICNPNASDFPNNCYSTWGPGGLGTGAVHYADLAVLTLASNVPLGYRPVVIGPPNSFATHQASSPTPVSWTVGTGMIDLFIKGCHPNLPEVQNLDNLMRWVPIDHFVDAPGGGSSDSDGSIQTTSIFDDPGDSGGPLYQQAPIPDGGTSAAYNLVLIGILSSAASCTKTWPDGGVTSTIGDTFEPNTWTSVLHPLNHAWVMQQGATVAPMVSYGTFGTSL